MVMIRVVFFLFFCFIWTFIYASCLGYNSTTWFIKLWCSAWYESVGRIVWRFLLSNKISIWLNGGIIFQPNIWLWNCAFAFAFAYCIRVAHLNLFLMHAMFLLEFGLPVTQNKVFGILYLTWRGIFWRTMLSLSQPLLDQTLCQGSWMFMLSDWYLWTEFDLNDQQPICPFLTLSSVCFCQFSLVVLCV